MAIADDLIGDESIVFQSEKHWIAPIRASLVAGLMVLGALFLRAIAPDNRDGFFGWVGGVMDLIAIGLLLAGIAWIAYNIVAWRTAEFAVTNMRILREEGLVRRRNSTTLLSSLSDVKTNVGFLGGRLNYGDIVILTTSGAAGEDRFLCITNPIEFRNAAVERKMALGAGQLESAPARVPAAPAPALAAAAAQANPAAPSSPASADDAATLLRLQDLRDKGAITPEEYEAKKTEILARM